MEQTPSYGRAFAKVAFVVLLLAIMSAPQLLSDEASPFFVQLRALLKAVPPVAWLVIGLCMLLGLGAIGMIRGIRSSSDSGAYSKILKLSIQDAVSPVHGGNGLVSDAFPLSLPGLGVVGWIDVRTPGMECVMIEGRRIVWRTGLFLSPMRLLGKPVGGRRVLLAPKPQVIPTVEALSADKWSTKLDATVTCRVSDPLRVLAEKPLDELKHMAQGVIAEHIHSHNHQDLLSDTGELRHALEQRLRASRSLSGLEIVEVPITVSGDERLIETGRLQKVQEDMRELVHLQGENRLTEAEFSIRIEQMGAQLADWSNQQEHVREMERLKAQTEAQNLQEMIRMVAQIAASGMDPAAALGEIKELLGDGNAWTVTVPAQPKLLSDSRLQKEQQALERCREKIGIREFDIEPNPAMPDNPGSVQIAFAEFSLAVECPDDYPQTAPRVVVQPGDDAEFEIVIPWNAASDLAQVAASALMQVPFELEARVEEER